MKKARKVKIMGDWWKYFVDWGAKDTEQLDNLDPVNQRTFGRIILYSPIDERFYCSFPDVALIEKRVVRASEVKKLFEAGKFGKIKY